MSDRFKKWKERIERHELNHTTGKQQKQWDYSCVICHQPSEIMKKEFRRFWKWYKDEIPEVISYSGKTEENLEELLAKDYFDIGKRLTGTEKALMKKQLVWLIESMRYEKNPGKTMNELGEIIVQMIIASDKFLKKGKEARELYGEYLSSESEGYSTDGSSKERDNSERTSWYKETLMEIIMKHNLDCEMGIESKTRDGSCQRCFPIPEGISENSNFLEFWEWFKGITNAKTFTGETVRIFDELKKIKFESKESRNAENFAELTLLALSIRYNKKPKYDIWEISVKIVEILAISSEFEIGIKEAIAKIKRRKEKGELSEESVGNSPEENSPEKGSPKENNSDEEAIAGSSKPIEEIHIEENIGIITIYVNKYGIYQITGTEKEFRIEVNEENTEARFEKDEVIELCGSTEEEMKLIFEEIIKVMQKLNEEPERTILEELEDDTLEMYNKDKGKDKETFEDNFDELENIINTGGFGTPKTSEFEKEFEIETDSDLEIEIINPIIDPLINMATTKVRKFDGDNMDPEDWLYEIERAMVANGTAANARLNYVTAQLQGQALRWLVRDQELPDDAGGRINAWDDQTDNGTIARSFTTKFKARFVSEDQKEEKKQDWYFQWARMKQGQGETIDAYIKRYRKLVERAEREITEEEQTIKFTEGLLPVYYSFATMGNAVNLTEAISNAKKAERGVTRQLTPQQEFIPDNRIYEEMNKEVTQKDEDKLEKMFKEMKIQLLQEVRGNNSYRNTGYRNNREVICYKCEKKGHYALNC